QVRLGQNAGAALRTLDEAQRVAVEVVANAEKLQLLRVVQAIEIEVKDPHTADLVGFDQREGRTLDLAFVTKTADQATRQRGLAGTEVPMQVDRPAAAARTG